MNAPMFSPNSTSGSVPDITFAPSSASAFALVVAAGGLSAFPGPSSEDDCHSPLVGNASRSAGGADDSVDDVLVGRQSTAMLGVIAGTNRASNVAVPSSANNPCTYPLSSSRSG